MRHPVRPLSSISLNHRTTKIPKSARVMPKILANRRKARILRLGKIADQFDFSKGWFIEIWDLVSDKDLVVKK